MMRSWRYLAPAMLLLAGLSAPAAAPAQSPQGPFEEVIIGFGGYYRPGHMTPLLVKLANHTKLNIVELQAVQADDDGDQMHWRVPAAVLPNQSSWHMLLVCPGPGALMEGGVTLSVIDERGEAVEALAVRDRQPLGPSGRTMMAVELPPGTRVVGVMGIDSQGFRMINPPGGPMSQMSLGFSQAHVGELPWVVNLPFERFPVVWQGLDMIDVIYWDDPEPAVLSSEQQVALAEWVRRGGQFVVGLGTHASELATAPTLAALLPVQIDAVGQDSRDLHELGLWLLGADVYAAQDSRYPRRIGQPLGQSVPVVRVSPRPSAVRLDKPRLSAPADAASAPLPPLLHRWAQGAGSVTVMSTSLRDSRLVSTLERIKPTHAANALAQLVNFHTHPEPIGGRQVALTENLGAHLDSAGVGGTLIAVVVLMSLAYAVVAGPGTWLYLRYRKKSQLNWWAFGAVAVAAIFASGLLAMFNVKGPSVSQYTVLDLAGDSDQGVVRGYFGLYEPAHRRVSLAVPDDTHALLTPMIDAHGGVKPAYPDVKDYELRSLETAEIDGVPIRRTIKRFELTWRGQVSGSVVATVQVGQNIHAEGQIGNQLPVDLTGARLIYAPADDRLEPQVVYLGRLPVGQMVGFNTLAANAQVKALGSFLTDLSKGPLGLSGSFGGNVATRDPLSRVVMLSLLERYPQPPAKDNNWNAIQLTRSLWSRLDRSEMLVPGKALLIAEANGYWPANVKFDRKNVGVEGPVIVRVLLDTQTR